MIAGLKSQGDIERVQEEVELDTIKEYIVVQLTNFVG